MQVIELLRWMRWATDRFQTQAGTRWVLENQKAKIKEEVKEFFDAVDRLDIVDRMGPDWIKIGEHDQALNRVIGEAWDVVFATVTMIHVLDISDNEFHRGLQSNIKKIEKRVASGHYVAGKHIRDDGGLFAEY